MESQKGMDRRGILKSGLAVAAGALIVNPFEAKAARQKLKQGQIYAPGVGAVYLKQPIIDKGHFSWSEATKYGNRIPTNEEISENIIVTARNMEEVRAYLGNKPMRVASWYRDPVTNKRVGGVSNSQHLYGLAVDFSHVKLNPKEVYDKLSPWLDEFFKKKKKVGGGLGLYPKSGFVHIDFREGKRARFRGR